MKEFAHIAGALALGTALVAAPAMAQDSAVVGTWDTKVESPMGEFPAKWTFAEGDDGYTLDIEPVAAEGGAGGPGGPGGPPMEMTVSDLVVEEGTFSFTQTVGTPQGDMAIAIAGTVEGDALTAEANTDFGAMPISGTRAE